MNFKIVLSTLRKIIFFNEDGKKVKKTHVFPFIYASSCFCRSNHTTSITAPELACFFFCRQPSIIAIPAQHSTAQSAQHKRSKSPSSTYRS